MNFEEMNANDLSLWVNEIDKEIEGIDTEMGKTSELLREAEDTVRICSAKLAELSSRKDVLKRRSSCLSEIEDQKYEELETGNQIQVTVTEKEG